MKVACVEYLNALPFTDALEALYKDNQLEYVKAVPSACARMLKTGEVDIALLPIGALVDFENNLTVRTGPMHEIQYSETK